MSFLNGSARTWLLVSSAGCVAQLLEFLLMLPYAMEPANDLILGGRNDNCDFTINPITHRMRIRRSLV
jgi:hypothetical protein